MIAPPDMPDSRRQKKNHETERIGACEEGGRDDRHQEPQRRSVREFRSERLSRHRADQIACEVGGTQRDCLR
jgi:hypothetical protein